MIKKLLLLSCLLTTPMSIVSADPLLENGDFSAKMIKPWKVFSLPNTPATKSKLADGVLTVTADEASAKTSNRQLVQQVKVVTGKKYRLDFDVKATLEKKAELQLVLVRGKNPSKPHYGLWRKLEVTPEWKTQTIYFKVKEIDPADPPLLKFLMGEMKGEISFRNVTLIEAKK